MLKITRGLHKTDEGEVIEFEKSRNLGSPIPYVKLLEFPELRESEPVRISGEPVRLRPQEFAVIERLIRQERPPH